MGHEEVVDCKWLGTIHRNSLLPPCNRKQVSIRYKSMDVKPHSACLGGVKSYLDLSMQSKPAKDKNDSSDL